MIWDKKQNQEQLISSPRCTFDAETLVRKETEADGGKDRDILSIPETYVMHQTMK